MLVACRVIVNQEEGGKLVSKNDLIEPSLLGVIKMWSKNAPGTSFILSYDSKHWLLPTQFKSDHFKETLSW